MMVIDIVENVDNYVYKLWITCKCALAFSNMPEIGHYPLSDNIVFRDQFNYTYHLYCYLSSAIYPQMHK